MRGKIYCIGGRITIKNEETSDRNFEVRGSLRAQFIQHCVATLEPLNSAIQSAILVRFSEDARTGKGIAKSTLMMNAHLS